METLELELELEKKIEGYTQECLSKTSLTEHELREFFEAFLSSVFLDSGKQPRFESYCKRYSRYETELTDYTQKCLDLFGVDLHKVVVQTNRVDLKVKQLTEWIHALSTLPFSSALNPILAKIQKVDWTQQKILEKLVEMNAVYVIKQLTYGVDLFNRIKRKQSVSMELLLPLYSSCSDYLDTLVATVETERESIDLATRELILESLKYMTDKIETYYNFMVERFKVIPNDQLERMYKHSLSTKVNLTTLLTEYTMTPMTPASGENVIRIKRLIDTLRKNYEKVIDMEKKWIKTIRGDNRIIEALKDYLNGYEVDDISLITMILMSINHLKGDLDVVVPVRRSVSSNIPRLAANESEKADEPKEPVTDMVTDTIKEPVTEMVTDTIKEPVTEMVKEPVTEMVKETSKEQAKEQIKEPNEPVTENLEKSGLTWGDTLSKVFGTTNTPDTEKEPPKEPSAPIFSTALEKFRGFFQPNVEVQDKSKQDNSTQDNSTQDTMIQAMREKVIQNKAAQDKALEEKMREERKGLEKKLQAERAVSKAALNDAYQKLKERGEFSKEQETKLETASKENYHKIEASLKARFATMEKELQEKHDKDVADNQSKIEIEIEKVKTQQRQLQQERAVDASTRSESELKERTKTLNTENLTPSGKVESVTSITPLPPGPPLQPLPEPSPETSTEPSPEPSPLPPGSPLSPETMPEPSPGPPLPPGSPLQPLPEPSPETMPEPSPLPPEPAPEPSTETSPSSPEAPVPPSSPSPAQSPEPSLPPEFVPPERLELLSLALKEAEDKLNKSKEVQDKLQLTVLAQAAKITLSKNTVSDAEARAAAAEANVEEITKQLKNISNSTVGSEKELNDQLNAARTNLQEAKDAAAVSQKEAYAVKIDADKRIDEIEEKLAQNQAKIVAAEAQTSAAKKEVEETKKAAAEARSVSNKETLEIVRRQSEKIIAEAESKVAQALSVVAQARAEADTAKINAQEASEAKITADQELDKIQKEILRVKNEALSAEEKIADLEEDVENYKMEISGIKIRIQLEIDKVISNKDKEIAKVTQNKKNELKISDEYARVLEDENEELKTEIQRKSALLSLSDLSLKNKKQEFEKAKQELKKLNEELVESKASSVESQNSMIIANEAAKAAEEKRINTEQKYALEIKSLKDELQEVKTTAEKQATEANESMRIAKAETDDTKAKLSNVSREKNVSNAEIRKLNEKVAEALNKAEVAEAAAKAAILRAEVSNRFILDIKSKEKEEKEMAAERMSKRLNEAAKREAIEAKRILEAKAKVLLETERIKVQREEDEREAQQIQVERETQQNLETNNKYNPNEALLLLKALENAEVVSKATQAQATQAQANADAKANAEANAFVPILRNNRTNKDGQENVKKSAQQPAQVAIDKDSGSSYFLNFNDPNGTLYNPSVPEPREPDNVLKGPDPIVIPPHRTFNPQQFTRASIYDPSNKDNHEYSSIQSRKKNKSKERVQKTEEERLDGLEKLRERARERNKEPRHQEGLPLGREEMEKLEEETEKNSRLREVKKVVSQEFERIERAPQDEELIVKRLLSAAYRKSSDAVIAVGTAERKVANIVKKKDLSEMNEAKIKLKQLLARENEVKEEQDIVLDVMNKKYITTVNAYIQTLNKTITEIAGAIATFNYIRSYYLEKTEILTIHTVPKLVHPPYPPNAVDCIPDTLLYYLDHYHALILYVDAMMKFYKELSEIFDQDLSNINEIIIFFKQIDGSINHNIKQMSNYVHEHLNHNSYVKSKGKPRNERIKLDLEQIYYAKIDLEKKIKELTETTYNKREQWRDKFFKVFGQDYGETKYEDFLKSVLKEEIKPIEQDDREGVFRIFHVMREIKGRDTSIGIGYTHSIGKKSNAVKKVVSRTVSLNQGHDTQSTTFLEKKKRYPQGTPLNFKFLRNKARYKTEKVNTPTPGQGTSLNYTGSSKEVNTSSKTRKAVNPLITRSFKSPDISL
jgi:hypothetical protein